MTDLEDGIEGVSADGRLLYFAIIAASFETQAAEVGLRHLKRLTALDDERFQAAADELYESALAYPVSDGDARYMEAMIGPELLCLALGAAGRPRAQDWEVLREDAFRRHGRKCIYCTATADAVDHVIALNHGGSNHPENLVPACKTCNSMKGGKTWPEWAAMRDQWGRH